jgi:hypothetical protein
MARESSVFEKLMVAPETTPGTEGTPYKVFALADGYPRPRNSGRAIRGAGGRDTVVVIQGKEYSEWPFEGPASFNDIVYPLAAHFKNPTAASGTFTYAPASFAADTLKTMSLIGGAVANGKKGLYGFCRDFRLRATLDEVTLSGMFHARKLATGAAFGSPTRLLPFPMQPHKWQVSVGTAMDASDLVALGAAEGVLEYEFSSTGRTKGQNVADGTDTFADLTHLASDQRLQLVMEDNSVAAGYLADLRNATDRLMRWIQTGPVIGAGPGTYKAQITCPFDFLEEDTGERDNLAGATFNVAPKYHPTFLTTGGSLEIVIVNELTSL